MSINLYGYALLSDAFYHAIKNAGLIKSHAEREVTFTELLARMPVTRVDLLYGIYTIMMLETGWPFNKPIPANLKRGDDTAARLVSVTLDNL